MTPQLQNLNTMSTRIERLIARGLLVAALLTAVKRKTRLGLLFMIVVMGFALLGGCALTSGREISAEQVSQISEGTTTKAQVELLFGKPKSKSVTSGNETWIYHHASEKYIPGSLGRGRYDQHGQTLMITFKSDIVVHYTFTTT